MCHAACLWRSKMSQVQTVPTVSINELRTLIPAIGKELTVVVQSEPGCGKTSLLKMMEEDLGDAYDYIYVDCPVKDMSDIAMTIPNHDTKTLESYVGSLFKMDSPKPKVILLDEFMKSPKLLQVIFTRLMLERTVGDTPLRRARAPRPRRRAAPRLCAARSHRFPTGNPGHATRVRWCPPWPWRQR